MQRQRIRRCIRLDDQPAETGTRFHRLPVPLPNFTREMIAEPLELANPLVDCSKVLFRKREHPGAGHGSRFGEFENLAHFLERKTKGLRLLDETQLVDDGLAVASISSRRTGRRLQQSQGFVVPDRRRRHTRALRSLTNQKSSHISIRHLEGRLKVKVVLDLNVGLNRYRGVSRRNSIERKTR